MNLEHKKTINKTQKRVIGVMIATTIMAVLIFIGVRYVNDFYRASTTAQKAIVGNDAVEVKEEDNYYFFHNVKVDEDSEISDYPGYGKGIIFYPGGKVEETAYAPLLLEFAEMGYDVYLVKMPAKLAIFGMNRAEEILGLENDVKEWIMMGHSLGGAMAASFCASHDEEIDGLVLLAAYSTEDLTDKEIDVYSFYGSEDTVLNLEKYNAYKENLPEDTVELVIEGGNHAYFGFYGEQEKDGTATINREEQMASVIDYMHIEN